MPHHVLLAVLAMFLSDELTLDTLGIRHVS